MTRAIELAALGKGQVTPNPLVGCVIVSNGQIIGEGWHQKFGGKHAEVNAMESVKKNQSVEGSCVYVTLEPCCHHGKTPPCTDLLIEKKVAKVFVAVEDPNPLVSGSGIKKLRAAGIEVQVGLLDAASREMNRRFILNYELGRPYIILKWAQTKDGFIARANNSSKWISNSLSRKMVHKWRFEEDGIMAGNRTISIDDPALTVRDWHGEHPTRIVLDRNLKISASTRVLDNEAKTLIYNTKTDKKKGNNLFIQVEKDNFLSNVFIDLNDRGVQSVLVEGGSKIHNELLKLNLWDECRVFISNEKFGKGLNAPEIKQEFKVEREIGNDILRIYRNGRRTDHRQ